MSDKQSQESEEKIKELILDLKNEDSNVRRKAAFSLRRFKDQAYPAVPILIERLNDKDPNVRKETAYTLGSIGEKAASAISTLIDRLNDENCDVQSNAALALGLIGSKSAPAVPILIELLKDKNDNIRMHAALALKRIGPQAAQAIPHLIEALNDDYINVRIDATYALGAIGKEVAIPPLIDCLQSGDYYLCQAAGVALGNIGEKAIPSLIEILENTDDEKIRSSVIVAFGKMGKQTDQIALSLIKHLNDQSVFVRKNTIIALGNIGSSVDPIIPSLFEKLNSRYNSRQINIPKEVKIALKKLGKPVVPYLISMVKDEKYTNRRNAIEVLGEMGDQAAPAIPNLIESLNDKVTSIRIAAAKTLILIGDKATSAIPNIKEAMSDLGVRTTVNEVLNKIDNHSFTELTEILMDVDIKEIFNSDYDNFDNINELIKKLKGIPNDISIRYEISKRILELLNQNNLRSSLFDELANSGDYVAELVNMIDTEGIHNAIWDLLSGLYYMLEKFGLSAECMPEFVKFYEEHYELESLGEILDSPEKDELAAALVAITASDAKQKLKQKAIEILEYYFSEYDKALQEAKNNIHAAKTSIDSILENKKDLTIEKLKSLYQPNLEPSLKKRILEEIIEIDKLEGKDIFDILIDIINDPEVENEIRMDCSNRLLRNNFEKALQEIRNYIENADLDISWREKDFYSWIGQKVLNQAEQLSDSKKIDYWVFLFEKHKDPSIRKKAFIRIDMSNSSLLSSVVNDALFDDDADIISIAASTVQRKQWDGFKDTIRSALVSAEERLEDLRYSPTIGEGRYRYESEVPEWEGIVWHLQEVYDSLKSEITVDDIDELLEAIDNTNDEYQNEKYYEEILAIDPNKSIPFLLYKLNNQKIDVRSIIIYSLQELFRRNSSKNISNYKEYLKQIKEIYEKENQGYIKNKLLSLIGLFETDEIPEDIIEAIHSKNGTKVLAAIQIINKRADLHNDEILEHLLVALKERKFKNSPTPSLTKNLTKTIRIITGDSRKVLPTFKEILTKDLPINFKTDLLEAFKEFPCLEAEEFLLELVKNDLKFGIKALRLFNEIPKFRVNMYKYENEILTFAESNKSPEAIKEISIALSSIGSRKSIPILIAIYDLHVIKNLKIEKVSRLAINSILERSDLETILHYFEKINNIILYDIATILIKKAKIIDKKNRKIILSKLKIKINEVKKEISITNEQANYKTILERLEHAYAIIKKQKNNFD